MSILHALTGLYDRLESNRKAPSYGFSRENISYAIVLSPEGSVSDVLDLRDMSGKTPKPSRREVPRPVKRTGQPAPNFLWDKTSFALGAGTGESSRILREHAAFKDFHARLLASSDDEGSQALLHFLKGWSVEEYDGLPHAQEMLDTNIVFSVRGETQYLHERSSSKHVWLNHLATEEGASGLCLVSGEQTTIARLHPSVKGVPGAQGSGASIVSFDKDAFKSFGKERGANAPVSERAAFAYTTSLNTLLERGSRQRIRIGDATTLFWADASGNEARASAAEDLFSMLLDPPTDEQEAAKVHDKLSAVAQGRPLTDVEPGLDGKDTRIFVLGLAPNAARLSIRFWYEDSVGAMARRIGEHWRDLRLEPTPWRTPPSARRLLYETAAQRKAENIPPTLIGALMRAILSGGRYPRSLLGAVIGRMRADSEITGLRAAICKASLARDHRLGLEEEDVPVSLNPDETNPAYRLGRLFAVYENVQRAALGNVNATIKDRFFASASATPALVFPILERSASNHLASLRKGDKGGLAHWFEREIDSIFSGVGSTFPRSLRLEDQGRFAIGYHHQRATKHEAPESDSDDVDAGTRVEDLP